MSRCVSGYLVSWYPDTICYLVLSPLLPISTSTLTLLLLTLALTPGTSTLPLVTGHVL